MRNKYHDSNIHSLIKVHYKLILMHLNLNGSIKVVWHNLLKRKYVYKGCYDLSGISDGGGDGLKLASALATSVLTGSIDLRRILEGDG